MNRTNILIKRLLQTSNTQRISYLLNEKALKQQIRLAHTGAIDCHKFQYVQQNQQYNVNVNKLLQAIRKSNQQEVWKQYLVLHDEQKINKLTPEYHSMILRALGLQNLVSYGPEEILAIKERLMMIWANMKAHEHTPDIRDYNHLLGFAGRAGDWILCQRIWDELMETSKSSTPTLWQLSPNVYSYNAYMMAAIQCKQPEKVANIFNNMQTSKVQPNVVSYNILMNAYGHLGDIAEVDKLFERIFIKQKQPKQPHITFWTSLLYPNKKSSTSLHMAPLVATITRRTPYILNNKPNNINSQKMIPNKETFLSLIDAHGRKGNTMGLNVIYEKLMPSFNIKPDLSIYNGLIRWYCDKSDIETARKLFFDMERQGVQPNVVTFNYIFRHEALKKNRPGVAEKLIDLMHQMYQLRPLQSMYRHLIKIHYRHNREHEADRLLRTYDQTFNTFKSTK
ncbi:unnamed protein product [Cunninghamella blakesleeana]